MDKSNHPLLVLYSIVIFFFCYGFYWSIFCHILNFYSKLYPNLIFWVFLLEIDFLIGLKEKLKKKKKKGSEVVRIIMEE